MLFLVANKKTRAPMPPRKVQAPQRRDTKKSGSQWSDIPRWVWFVAIGAVAAAVIVIAVLASGGGNSSKGSANVKAQMLAAGCTYRDVPPNPPVKNKGDFHQDFPTPQSPIDHLWSTSPPSGGSHYGLWAVWGFYRTPVNPRLVVHNEEHGAVVMWWGPKVPKATVDKLATFYDQGSDGMFGTPYAGLGNKIALTAWTGDPTRYYKNGYYGIGHIAVCPAFNQKAFAAFRDAYVGQGPEGIPLSSDKQGMGPTQ
jgi:hypothetical protein